MIQPYYIDLYDWAASLIIDFPDDPIPVLYRDMDWKDWGNQLILCNSFYEAGAPGTFNYDDWLNWAQDVYLAMLDSA